MKGVGEIYYPFCQNLKLNKQMKNIFEINEIIQKYIPFSVPFLIFHYKK